jgi:flagellin-like protein
MAGKKGVSPLIATVILIVIVVSIGGMLFTWVKTYENHISDRTRNNTRVVMGCAGAALEIMDVYLQNGTNATARAVVKNTGQPDNLTIDDANVYNNQGQNFTANNIPMTLKRGELGIIFFSANIQQCMNFSKVSVAATCGDATDEFTATPKGC